MDESLKGFALAILILTLSACVATIAPRPLKFPQEAAPSEMIAIAQAHLEKKLDENWGLSATYNHHIDTLQLAGAQKLFLEQRDASNNVLEQWCIVFQYDLERGDPDTIVETYSIYQTNLKGFGWIPTFLPNLSESFLYQQSVVDTWERCIGY